MLLVIGDRREECGAHITAGHAITGGATPTLCRPDALAGEQEQGHRSGKAYQEGLAGK